MKNCILYTTHCPKCKILEKKLSDKSVSFETCEDTEIMKEKGVRSVPVLEVDGTMMPYYDAVKYVNSI